MSQESHTSDKMPTVNISRTFLTFMYTLKIFVCLEIGVILAQGNLPEEESKILSNPFYLSLLCVYLLI